ncbi:MAG: hypothetical protein RMJ15_02005 [Nitrososphaerota archaeon]|nr:hypothetical protein [Candidatus Bathyarchaeota archaeon]MDW8022507.1 hypothetical protein [Nitrososphaerota archaeon]
MRGAKLANFYIRAMGETSLFKVKVLNELNMLVDKQITRFTVYTGVLRLKSGKFQGCANDDPLRSLIQERSMAKSSQNHRHSSVAARRTHMEYRLKTMHIQKMTMSR